MTHWIVGDGLHISSIYQLPYQKDFSCLGTKDKQSQTLPLKEDFRQVTGHITSQVFQTTWRRDVIPQCLSYQAKQKQVHKGTIATKVPENNPTQSVYNSKKKVNRQQTVNCTQAMHQAKHKLNSKELIHLQNNLMLININQILIQMSKWIKLLNAICFLSWKHNSNISTNH